jgi:hypothetical protein
MSLAAILLIIALVGCALHTILWLTVPTYRHPWLFYVSTIIGFVGALMLALHGTAG